MKQKAIIDSSILVKIILEKDKELLKDLYKNYEIFVPVNALEEAGYIIIRESVREKFGEERFYEMKKLFENEDIDLIKKRLKVLNELCNIWNVIEIDKDIFEISKKIVLKYKLLPNDSLIVAAAKYYNIPKMITKDKDFKRIDFIDIELI